MGDLALQLTSLLEQVESMTGGQGGTGSRRSSSSRTSAEGAGGGEGAVVWRLAEAVGDMEATLKAKDRAIKDGQMRIRTLEMEWGDLRRKAHFRLSPSPE